MFGDSSSSKKVEGPGRQVEPQETKAAKIEPGKGGQPQSKTTISNAEVNAKNQEITTRSVKVKATGKVNVAEIEHYKTTFTQLSNKAEELMTTSENIRVQLKSKYEELKPQDKLKYREEYNLAGQQLYANSLIKQMTMQTFVDIILILKHHPHELYESVSVDSAELLRRDIQDDYLDLCHTTGHFLKEWLK